MWRLAVWKETYYGAKETRNSDETGVCVGGYVGGGGGWVGWVRGLVGGRMKKIGNTPLIRLNKISDETGCEIYGKVTSLWMKEKVWKKM